MVPIAPASEGRRDRPNDNWRILASIDFGPPPSPPSCPFRSENPLSGFTSTLLSKTQY